MRGLEPPRAFAHTDLNRARLPIPPHPRGPRSLAWGLAPRARSSCSSSTGRSARSRSTLLTNSSSASSPLDQGQLLLAAPAGAGAQRAGAHAFGQPRPFRSHDDEDGGDEQSDRDPTHVFHCNAGSRSICPETPQLPLTRRRGAGRVRYVSHAAGMCRFHSRSSPSSPGPSSPARCSSTRACSRPPAGAAVSSSSAATSASPSAAAATSPARSQELLQPLVERRPGALDAVAGAGDHARSAPRRRSRTSQTRQGRGRARPETTSFGNGGRGEPVEWDLRLPGPALGARRRLRAPLELREAGAPGGCADQSEDKGAEELREELELRPRGPSPRALPRPTNRGRRVVGREGERGRLDHREGAHRLGPLRGGEQRDHAAVGVPDEVRALAERLGDQRRVDVEVDPARRRRLAETGPSTTRSVQRSARGSCSRQVLAPPVTLPWTSRTGGPSPSRSTWSSGGGSRRRGRSSRPARARRWRPAGTPRSRARPVPPGRAPRASCAARERAPREPAAGRRPAGRPSRTPAARGGSARCAVRARARVTHGPCEHRPDEDDDAVDDRRPGNLGRAGSSRSATSSRPRRGPTRPTREHRRCSCRPGAGRRAGGCRRGGAPRRRSGASPAGRGRARPLRRTRRWRRTGSPSSAP